MNKINVERLFIELNKRGFRIGPITIYKNKCSKITYNNETYLLHIKLNNNGIIKIFTKKIIVNEENEPLEIIELVKN